MNRIYSDAYIKTLHDRRHNKKVINVDYATAKKIYQARCRGERWADLEIEFDLYRKTMNEVLKRYGLFVPLYKQKERETWTRPCLKCGSTARRAKWQYICEVCQRSNEQYSGALAI